MKVSVLKLPSATFRLGNQIGIDSKLVNTGRNVNCDEVFVLPFDRQTLSQELTFSKAGVARLLSPQGRSPAKAPVP